MTTIERPTLTIAVAGKGGTGKTTLAALIIRYLARRHLGTILAIDADPAANLHLALGLPLETTVGDIREGLLAEVQGGAVGAGITRRDFLDTELRLAVEEGEQVDLLVMGRPEGQGCYCPVNHMLRDIIDRLGRQYDFVVIDNEAGMEHLSRRTTRDVDVLLVVTDPTVRGVTAAEGILRLAEELQIHVGQALVVVNRTGGELPAVLRARLDALPAPVAVVVPDDPAVGALDAAGQPLVLLAAESPALRAIEALSSQIVALGARTQPVAN
jgi:CO dehydrogenase maturation factor